MLLWIEQAMIDVVLCASSVSMFALLPILMVPPYLGFVVWASAAPASGPGAGQADRRPAERAKDGAAVHFLLHELVDDFESVSRGHEDPPPV